MLVHAYLIAPYAKRVDAWILAKGICTYKQQVEANKCLGLDLYALHYGTTGEYKPSDEANLGGKWWPLPLLSCISSGKA